MSRNKNIKAHTIDNLAAGKRIDIYLRELLDDRSRSYVQRLIESENVLVNGCTVSKNHKLKTGEILEVKTLDSFESLPEIEPQQIRLKIIFEDDYLLIISKPPGISVHPSPGNYSNTLVNALMFHFEDSMKSFPDKIRPGIVHRLDKETSGILIVAKNNVIQYRISELFKRREVKKCYIALVLGLFREKGGVIELPIGRSRVNRQKMQVSVDKGRDASTRFDVMESFNNGCSLLHVFPETGRTHQIRVHFSYIDHPVIGDKKYGNKETEIISKTIGLTRHFLHAFKLSFYHPVTNKYLELVDEMPEDLLKSLEFLREFKI